MVFFNSEPFFVKFLILPSLLIFGKQQIILWIICLPQRLLIIIPYVIPLLIFQFHFSFLVNFSLKSCLWIIFFNFSSLLIHFHFKSILIKLVMLTILIYLNLPSILVITNHFIILTIFNNVSKLIYVLLNPHFRFNFVSFSHFLLSILFNILLNFINFIVFVHQINIILFWNFVLLFSLT